MSPKYQLVYTAKTLLIDCDSSLPVKWIKKGNGEKLLRTRSNNSLVILKVKEKDAGVYICIGADMNRSIFSEESRVWVGSK